MTTISRETNSGAGGHQSSAWRWIDGQYMPQMPLADIEAWELNPRKHFDEASLKELADSIREHGVQQPVVVRYLPPGEMDEVGRLLIVMGERRWRASQLAGRDTIPAVVRVGMDDAQALTLAMAENVRRRDLNAIEEARGYGRLVEMGKRQAEIARDLGCDPSAVSNARRLLKLPEDVQEMIADGRLSAGHGKAILRFEEFPELISAIAEEAVKGSLSVRELEASLPIPEKLRAMGLVRALDSYRMLFDIGVCKHQCPFSAYRKVNDWAHYCLKPAHFDELQAAAKEEQIRKAQTAADHLQQAAPGKIADKIAKAEVSPAAVTRRSGDDSSPSPLPMIVADGPKVLDLSKLDYNAYDDLRSNVPPTCTADCACRANAIDRQGRCVEVCLDPGHLNALRGAETKVGNKRRREEHKTLIEDVRRKRLTDLDEATAARWLAMMLWDEICRSSVEDRRKLVQELPEGLRLRDIFADESYTLRTEKNWPVIAELGMVGILNLAVELKARADLRNAREMHHDHHSVVDWILNPISSACQPGLIDGREETLGTARDGCPDESDDDSDPDNYHCMRCNAVIALDLLGSPVAEMLMGGRWHRMESGLLIESDEGSDELLTLYCARCAPEVRICRYCGCTDENGCEEGCSWITDANGRIYDVCTACDDELNEEAQAVQQKLLAGVESLIGPQGRPYRIIPGRYLNEMWEVQASDTDGPAVRFTARSLVLRRWLPAEAPPVETQPETWEFPMCRSCGVKPAIREDLCIDCAGALDNAASHREGDASSDEAVLCKSCGVEQVWATGKRYCADCDPHLSRPSIAERVCNL